MTAPSKVDVLDRAEVARKALNDLIGDLEWRLYSASDFSEKERDVLKYARDARLSINIALGDMHTAVMRRD